MRSQVYEPARLTFIITVGHEAFSIYVLYGNVNVPTHIPLKRFSCPHRHPHTPRTAGHQVSIDVIQRLPFWDGTRLDGMGLALLFFFIPTMLAMISPAIIPCRLASHSGRRSSIIYLPAVLCAYFIFTVVISGNLGSTIWKLIGRKILVLIWL